MNKGWLELESDPGLFTLLLEDFGVNGVQVEEIYDLQKPIEGPVYGFIFLFKWIEERRSRRKIIQEEESFVVDEAIVNSMFFAQQVISNSCATHALLSVLLNCDKLKLGDTLTRLKQFSQNMNPEDKGNAIGNMPDLARAHNSHARPEPCHLPERQSGISTGRTKEAFHFVSYVPINGRLFELDGLKPYPIDHGPWGEHEEWTEKFRRVITERLGMATGGEPYHDIRFNLMAVVPDRRQQYEHKLNTLKTNRQIVLEALQQMVKVTSPEISPIPRSLRGDNKPRAEPMVTRSSAAKESQSAPPSNNGNSQLTLRTRLKQKMATPTSSASPSPPVSSPRLPPALDSHNYAKSPILEMDITDSGRESTGENDDLVMFDSKPEVKSETVIGEEKVGIEALKSEQLQTVKDKSVKIEISVSDEKEGLVTMPTTVATTDVTKPLIIQTKFASSPGPGSESTDTASEVGSGFNSPLCSTHTSSQNSPNISTYTKLRSSILESGQLLEKIESVQRLTRTKEQVTEALECITATTSGATAAAAAAAATAISELKLDKDKPLDASCTSFKQEDGTGENKSKFSSQQGFTPKDLLALLKNVESEISICENNLRDEVEKRKKYKVDDCRRTHNYDQFICTFLSMLAEQGQLADMVQQHMLIKRRQGVNIGRLHKINKPDRRRRSRPKKRR